MADETIKPDEKPVDAPKEEPKDEGYDYAADHDRDIKEIAQEPIVEEKPSEESTDNKSDAPDVDKDAKTEPTDKKHEPVLNPLDEAKAYLEEQRKAATEAAKQAAKDSVKDELARTKEESAREAKEADEMKPLWEKEGRAPKDYDEVARENRRITKLELKQEMRAEAEASKQAEETKSKQTQEHSQQQLEQANSRIGRDMRDLYEGGYLPEIKTPGDPNDPGEKAKQALFQLGVEHNLALKEAGKDPEPSIAKIFFMNKDKVIAPKVEQPAGADAPVSGAKPASVTPEDTGYVYARDHNPNETVTQYARRIAAQSRKG